MPHITYIFMNREQEIATWLSAMSGQSVTAPISSHIKNGYVLALTMNRLQPGAVRAPKNTTAPFMAMEQITNVINAARKYGVEEHYLFRATDLWEGANAAQVMNFIDALGRQAQAKNFDGPALGVKVVEGRKTEFTEEQLLRTRAAAPQITSGTMYHRIEQERKLDHLDAAKYAKM